MSYTTHRFLNIVIGGYAGIGEDFRQTTRQRGELARHIHRIAENLLGAAVTPLIRSRVEDWYMFTVLPSGSKDGWQDDAEDQEARNKLVEELRKWRYPGGSSPIKWIEVQIGDDGSERKITRHGRSR